MAILRGPVLRVTGRFLPPRWIFDRGWEGKRNRRWNYYIIIPRHRNRSGQNHVRRVLRGPPAPRHAPRESLRGRGGRSVAAAVAVGSVTGERDRGTRILQVAGATYTRGRPCRVVLSIRKTFVRARGTRGRRWGGGSGWGWERSGVAFRRPVIAGAYRSNTWDEPKLHGPSLHHTTTRPCVLIRICYYDSLYYYPRRRTAYHCCCCCRCDDDNN